MARRKAKVKPKSKGSRGPRKKVAKPTPPPPPVPPPPEEPEDEDDKESYGHFRKILKGSTELTAACVGVMALTGELDRAERDLVDACTAMLDTLEDAGTPWRKFPGTPRDTPESFYELWSKYCDEKERESDCFETLPASDSGHGGSATPVSGQEPNVANGDEQQDQG
jgi:hypothetical protein